MRGQPEDSKCCHQTVMSEEFLKEKKGGRGSRAVGISELEKSARGRKRQDNCQMGKKKKRVLTLFDGTTVVAGKEPDHQHLRLVQNMLIYI